MSMVRFLVCFFPVTLYFVVREITYPIPDNYSRSLLKFLNDAWRFIGKLLVPAVTKGKAEDFDIYFQPDSRSSGRRLRLDLLTKEIFLSLFGFLDLKSLQTCALVSRDWYILSSADEFWKSHCMKGLRNEYLFGFSNSEEAIIVAENILNKVYQASKLHKKIVYAISNIDIFQWKQFLATTRFCDRYSGSGRSVVIYRDEVKPHHVLNFVRKLGEEKQSEFALEILDKFLSFYTARKNNPAARGFYEGSNSSGNSSNLFTSSSTSKGYIFRNRVACSVREFEEFVAYVPGLTVPALVEFFG
uniref:F-box domain-containing protein n=1 Tax=Aplanochytrium stocchinoi TaxID=215587 RepID=A0A7S3UZG9_9STRA